MPPGFRPPGFGESRPNQETKKPYSLDNANEKARTELKKQAILEGDFTELYGEDNIEADLSYVYEKRKTFERENSPYEKEAVKLAEIFEAVICSQINSAQLLGPYAKSVKASEYDDVKHGVDEIVELRQPNLAAHYLGLGIDVTFGANLEKKFQRIKDEIENGQLTTIKYLKTPDYQGRRTNVPRLVIAVDGETVRALAQAWYSEAPGLKDNVVKYQILKELTDQLALFENYARKVGQPEAAQKYAEAAAVIEPLFMNVKKIFDSKNYKHELTDRAYEEMQKLLGTMFM